MARAGSGHRDSGPPARRLAEPPAGSVTHIWLDLRRREGNGEGRPRHADRRVRGGRPFGRAPCDGGVGVAYSRRPADGGVTPGSRSWRWPSEWGPPGPGDRFESGADARLSTVARYAAAIGVKVECRPLRSSPPKHGKRRGPARPRSTRRPAFLGSPAIKERPRHRYCAEKGGRERTWHCCGRRSRTAGRGPGRGVRRVPPPNLR